MVIAPTIEVANLGMADSLILMVMALVVFGPRRLPQIGRQIGKLMYEFRKASNDFKFQMEEELRNAEEADRRQKEEQERQRRLAENPPSQIEASTPSSTEAPVETESSDLPDNSYSEIAEAQEKAEAEQLTIKPPSTGEPVAAERPNGADAQTEDAEAPSETKANESAPAAYAEPHPIEPGPVQNEGYVEHDTKDVAEETEKTIEPAAHNG